MTDREKAIVMAYTGICMLTGDKFQIFHKYVEDIMGRPVWTHEMTPDSIADEIKEKSKADFIALCADESNSENSNKFMTYSDIYDEFCKKFPNTEVSDYRPAYPQYLPSLVKPIPYAIVVWLKDGSKMVYIAEEVKDD